MIMKDFANVLIPQTLWPLQLWSCMWRVSCQKGPTRHAYAWQIGPFWQDTLDIHGAWLSSPFSADYKVRHVFFQVLLIITTLMTYSLQDDTIQNEPEMAYCQLDSWEQISVEFESEFYHIHSWKLTWKCHLQRRQPFCPGGDEFSILGRCE